MKKFVVMSGGFHPFHAGHASLYQQAKEAFPDAKVLVCATNVQSDRPFPFSLKKKLAQLSGVPPKDFIEVSRQFTIQDPALAQRIGNPDDAIVIYVRSDKDRNEAPQPWKLGPDGKPPVGKKGPKKGLPLSNYLLEYPGEGQPLEPVSKHAYMAYLKTVEFGPGITSASEIRNAWPKLNEKRKLAMVMSLYPTTKSNPKLAQNVVGMFDQVMGEQHGVAEGSEHYDGIEISMEKEDDEIMVRAMMAGGRELGHVLFVIDGEYLAPQDLEVDERYQGQGIAATMYDYVKSKGYKIRRSGQQTDAGAGFWDKHKPGKNVWEQGVAEDSQQISEYRDRLLQYVKSLLPNYPEYVLKDWLIPNKGDFSNLPDTDLKNGIMEKLKLAGLTPNTKWQLVPNM